MEQLVVDLLRANDVSTPLPISIDEGFTEVVTFLKAGDRVHALLAAEALLLAPPAFLDGVSVTGPTATISVADTVPVGSTIFVDTVFRNAASPPTVTDTAGNTYMQNLTETRSGDSRTMRFRAPVTTALAPGDEIVLDGYAADPAGTGAAIAYFVATDLDTTTGIARVEFTDATEVSTGGLAVATAPTLLLGLLETDDALQRPTEMGQFDQFGLQSNAGAENRSVLAARRVVSDADTYEWAITLHAPRTGSITLMSYPIVAP